jgi:hypothetical protein
MQWEREGAGGGGTARLKVVLVGEIIGGSV